MRKITSLVLSLFVLAACNDNPKEDQVVLTSSSGNINNLSVIIENELWNGEVGDSLRKVLAAPVDGLPQEEPLFSISQMPPEAFSGFVRKNRIFLRVQKGKEANVKVAENPYARPQTGVLISGQTNEEIINQLEEHSEEIVKAFKETEIKEKQRRMKKSLKDDKRLEEELGLSLKFPTAYRYAKEEDDFFWIRKDIKNGSMEILAYEVPRHVLEKDTNVIGNIIAMRDSIGQKHIPGPLEDTYMITEEAYAPYLFESQIDGKFAWETKGTWEVKGAFMAGPFLNYAVLDEKNDRYVVIEGFAFAPSAMKRDHMQEIEAILKSADIK
ncbi:protein of unknown function [Salinimicrobium catena]|uniref:DUF4837 family protein n=1 Tax=Salinimicrobium catena TaxID=390640 RepID=A0A1H5IHF0_9FLAO|nr:DUF4837 family protein [Salinimicrobium catena]SDK77826.1 protein of unknown function [Salinimicrobium catena]SEE39652.1 protein of unknown function [Salinimicrobium catena]